MHRQTVQFAVTRSNGSIARVGKASVLQPKTNFTGGSIKFYKDKPKEKDR